MLCLLFLRDRKGFVVLREFKANKNEFEREKK
jgi:hypothetical protein